MVSLDEAKNYLRIDIDEDDVLIETLINTAVQLCSDVARYENEDFEKSELSKTAVLYAVGYLYEHRENDDHHELTCFSRSEIRD